MAGKQITLASLPIGKKARVKSLTLDGTIRRRIMDLGLVSDTIVEALQKVLPVTLPLIIFVVR